MKIKNEVRGGLGGVGGGRGFGGEDLEEGEEEEERWEVRREEERGQKVLCV